MSRRWPSTPCTTRSSWAAKSPSRRPTAKSGPSLAWADVDSATDVAVRATGPRSALETRTRDLAQLCLCFLLVVEVDPWHATLVSGVDPTVWATARVVLTGFWTVAAPTATGALGLRPAMATACDPILTRMSAGLLRHRPRRLLATTSTTTADRTRTSEAATMAHKMGQARAMETDTVIRPSGRRTPARRVPPRSNERARVASLHERTRGRSLDALHGLPEVASWLAGLCACSAVLCSKKPGVSRDIAHASVLLPAGFFFFFSSLLYPSHHL